MNVHKFSKRMGYTVEQMIIMAIVGCVILSTIIIHSAGRTEVIEVRRSGPPTRGIAAEADKEFWIEKLLDAPRVFHLHNVLSESECNKLIAMGESKGMSEALITPYGSNELVPSSTRTNTAAWLDFQQNDLVEKLENKIAEVTGTQPEWGENLQILHYANGNHYFKEHRDYFDPVEDPPENFQNGGNRMVTAITYLKTPTEGGETYFTKIDFALKVKPGDMIIFWDLKPDGSVDPDTYHSALPPSVGEKWVAVKWVHEGVYQKSKVATGEPTKKVEILNTRVTTAAR